MIYIFNKSLQLIEILKLPLAAKMTRRLVGTNRISIEDYVTNLSTIAECSFIGAFYGDRFYIFRIITKEIRNDRISLEGIDYALDELANISIIEDRRPQNVTASDAVLSAIQGTGWELGIIETTPLNSTNFYFISPLQAIQKVIEIWGIEPDFYFEFNGKEITGRKIDIYQTRGRESGERYVYGSDLLEIIYEENRSDIITALYGRGKGEELLDGEGRPTGTYGRRLDFGNIIWSTGTGNPINKPLNQEYIEIPEMTALYGYPTGSGILTPRFDVYINDQITDANELIKETYKVLVDRSRPLVTLTSTVAKAGPYQLGDTNYIIRPDLGIQYSTRIFEDEIDLVTPENTRFKFGDYVISAQAQRAKNIQSRFDGLNDKINSVDATINDRLVKISDDWYDVWLETKESIFFSGESYNYSLDEGNDYGLPAGFYSFDAPIDGDPGPTGFLTIRSGKIGRGSILPDGSWTFNLIGDDSGLTADAITAGKVKAEFVEIGSSSTFADGYDPSEKANSSDVYTKQQIDTEFSVLDGSITARIQTEVEENLGTAPIYTWVRYADDIYGNGITSDPNGKAYLGLAAGKTSPTASNIASDYSWSLIKGADGIDGIDGEDGEDGVSYYTWIKYADTPTTGMSDYPAGKMYIGIAHNKTTATESSVYSDYQWSKIQGVDGIPGEPGSDGITYYTWIKYADSPTTGMSDLPDGKLYIGLAFNKTTPNESTSYSDYAWSLIKSQGIVSVSEQYYRSTSNSSLLGGSWLDSPPAYLANTYIWTRLKTVWKDPTETTYSTPTLSGTWDALNNTISRVTNVESKVTPTAIIQTVEQQVNQNGSTVLATKGDINLTEEAWVATFSQIGKGLYPNLLKDSHKDLISTTYLIGIYDMVEDWLTEQVYTITIKGSLNAGQKFGIWANGANTKIAEFIPDPSGITSHTFTTPATINTSEPLTLRVYNYPNATATSGSIDWVKLERGSLATEWSAAPDELVTGITRVDRYGINVSDPESAVNTQITNDGLSVRSGDKLLATFGYGQGAQVPYLISQNIIGNIINILDQSVVLDIGSGKPFASITKALESLDEGGKRVRVLGDKTITLNIYGSISDNVYLRGYLGGYININFQSQAKLNGRIYIEACTSAITIKGYSSSDYGTIKYNGAADMLIQAVTSPYLEVRNMNFDKGSGSTVTGLGYYFGSMGYVINCDFGTCEYGIRIYYGSVVTVVGNRGNCSTVSYYVVSAMLFARSTKPVGTLSYGNGHYFPTGTISDAASTFTSPPTSPTQLTEKFYKSSMYTMLHGTSTRATSYGAAAAQGKWEGMSNYMDGYIEFNRDAYDFIQGGSSTVVELWLYRTSDYHGTSSPVAPDADNFSATFPGAGRGEWVKATISSALLTSSGSVFRFYSPTINSGYAIFSNAYLKVTTTKNI